MTISTRFLLVSAAALAAAVPARAAVARALPIRQSDRAALYNEAQQLFARAGTLGHGSASDRRMAAELFRRAAELYEKAGAPRDVATALNSSGVTWLAIGQPDSALKYLRPALAIFRSTGDRGVEGVTLNNIGEVYRTIGRPDSALRYFREALPMVRAAGRRGSEATTLGNIGAVFGGVGQPDSALAYYRLALPLDRAVGDRSGEATTLNNLGAVFRGTGRPDSAMAYYRQALPITRALGDRMEEALTLSNIGDIYRAVGRSDSAMGYFRQALPMQRAAGDRVGEAVTLINIGGVYRDTGQPDSALASYRLALPVARSAGDRVREAVALSNIGVVYRDIGQPDSALAYYGQALPIRRAAHDRSGEATTLGNIGGIYRGLGQPDSALAYYRLALPIQDAIGDRGREANTLGNIGALYHALRKPDSAVVYYRLSLAIRRAVADRAGEAATLSNIGAIFRDIGKPQSALEIYRQALPIRRAVGDRAGEAVTLQNMAIAFRDLGRLDSATMYFDRSTVLFSTIARRAGNEFNQLSYDETTTDIYGVWALTWLAASPDKAAAAAGALAASERGHAQALLDLMRDTTSRVAPGADFPAEGARLVASLRRSGSAGLVYLSAGDTLITWVIPTTGDIEAFRSAIPRDTVAALIGAFREDLGVESRNARLALRGAPLERGVSQTAARAASGSATNRARTLAMLLLPAQVVSRLGAAKEVVIVPQGPLGLVPFAALPVGEADEPFGSKLAIRYAPSLATLSQAEARPGLATGSARAGALTRSLVVGNPLMPEVVLSNGSRDRLSPLPGAESEGRGIATQLGVPPLIGAAATEAEVVRRLPGAPVVHLATHGFAYATETNARSSFVALSPDRLNDGLLTVGNILDNPELTLKADLVVLSACQSGLGNLRQAEGTVGLQRAFLAKGARSVLVSLWSVSDAATSALMTAFYRHWLKDSDGPSKAEALRRAQEEVRRTTGFEAPRFWAAFQLVGAR